jgi:hypothetical protein
MSRNDERTPPELFEMLAEKPRTVYAGEVARWEMWSDNDNGPHAKHSAACAAGHPVRLLTARRHIQEGPVTWLS